MKIRALLAALLLVSTVICMAVCAVMLLFLQFKYALYAFVAGWLFLFGSIAFAPLRYDDEEGP